MTESVKKFDPYPLLVPSVAFVAGILFETEFSFSTTAALIISIVGLAAAAALRRSKYAKAVLAVAFISIGCFATTIEIANENSDRIKTLFSTGQIASGDPVEIEGTLKTQPEPTADAVMLRVNVDRLTYRGQTREVFGTVQVYVVIADDSSEKEFNDLDLNYGSRVSIGCELNREDQYQNPGVVSRLELLDRHSIDAVATLKSPLLLEKVGEDSVWMPIALVYQARQNLLYQIRTRFSASTAGVLIASTLGNKYFLDKTTADAFRDGGTFHVLVISGLHITFIGGLLLLLSRGIVRRRFVQFLIVSGLLWSYTLAVGAEIPVVRASMMFTILLFTQAIYRQGTLLNSLSACVLILLLWRPSDVFDPSFQLTLVSVFAIVAFAFPLIEKLRMIGEWMPSLRTPFPPNVPSSLKRFCETLYWNPAAWNIEVSRQIWTARIEKSPFAPNIVERVGRRTIAYAFEGLLVSLMVQLCLLPFLVVYFHRITPVSVFMNLWVGAVMAVESFSAFAGLILSQLSASLAAPLFSLTEFLNYLLVNFPRTIVQSDWASWRVPVYPGSWKLIYTVYFIPLCAMIAALRKWKPFEITDRCRHINVLSRKLKLSTAVWTCSSFTAAFALVIIFHPFSSPAPDGRLHIDFLDVGQGDSAFVTFPDGTTMLVDGGGKVEFRGDEDQDTLAPDIPGIGEAVVSPVLWEKGYSKVDYILATHADADHIQGLADVAKNFQVGEALFGRMPADDPEFAALQAVLKKRGIPMAYVTRGQSVRFGDAVVEVLYPRRDDSPDAASDNDHSIVLRITLGIRAFLFTGDIEQTAETDLLNSNGRLAADLIKVPHHGSRTSSTQNFVAAVKPRYAVISVGNHSRFGHPHREVVERWQAAGAKVMRTGQTGMISLSTDGEDLEISTFSDRMIR
jgi:competence protein ComEC